MVSTSSALPIFTPPRRCMQCGDWLMLSCPPATTICAVAGLDRLIAERHRAQARAAELVDAVGGLLIRDAGRDRGLARRVLPRAGGEDLAEDDLVDLRRLDLGALQGLDDRDLAELVRGQACSEPPLKAPTGVRAAAAMTMSVMMSFSIGMAAAAAAEAHTGQIWCSASSAPLGPRGGARARLHPAPTGSHTAGRAPLPTTMPIWPAAVETVGAGNALGQRERGQRRHDAVGAGHHDQGSAAASARGRTASPGDLPRAAGPAGSRHTSRRGTPRRRLRRAARRRSANPRARRTGAPCPSPGPAPRSRGICAATCSGSSPAKKPCSTSSGSSPQASTKRHQRRADRADARAPRSARSAWKSQGVASRTSPPRSAVRRSASASASRPPMQ